jgi:hypothetical protein
MVAGLFLVISGAQSVPLDESEGSLNSTYQFHRPSHIGYSSLTGFLSLFVILTSASNLRKARKSGWTDKVTFFLHDLANS